MFFIRIDTLYLSKLFPNLLIYSRILSNFFVFEINLRDCIRDSFEKFFMLAIYRKYRPKKLSDVLGQETITEILRNAAKSERLAHSYLFYGPRGSGKTTTARIPGK